MGGKSTQETRQQSSSEPWKPTQGGLISAINAIAPGLTAANVNANPAEDLALKQIQTNAAGIPNYTGQATGLLNDLFGGGTDRTGVAQGAYDAYKSFAAPFLTPGYADPMQTPGMANVLDTIRSDVTNSVNGLFAGAGRDLSGAHAQALARGISQGEAVPLLNQYNTNVGNQLGLAGNLYNAGNQTAGVLSGLDQTALGNKLLGLNTAPSVNQADAGANATLQANQMARGLPISNLAQYLNLLLPIAGLGGQSQGTSNTTSQMSGAQQFGLITGGLANLFGGKK